MKIFALSDLHLSKATPDKEMSVFGEHWNDHAARISRNWRACVGDDDLIIVAGDISWAMRLEQAVPDLAFIGEQPGRKVLIRGNHDYWWQSAAKVRACLPAGTFILHNDALTIDGVGLAGSRLWVDHELPPLNLPVRSQEIDAGLAGLPGGAPPSKGYDSAEHEQDEKIYLRELNRLQLSLAKLDADAKLKIAVVHFPPLSTDMGASRATSLLEAAGVDHCVFGHLHNLAASPGKSMIGSRKGIAYHLTSCDYLDFVPALIAQV